MDYEERNGTLKTKKTQKTKKGKKSRLGRYLVFWGVLLGLIFSIENHYHVFRLGRFKVTPVNQEAESLVLRMIPPSAHRFWPILLVKKNKIVSKVEENFPVNASLTVEGWGKFRLVLTPLMPVFSVVWNDRIWYVDIERKMWRSNLQANTVIAGIRAPDTPWVHWSSSLVTPFRGGDKIGDIASSNIPVEEILEWIRLLQSARTCGAISDIAPRTIEGTTRVIAAFDRSGQSGQKVRIVLPEDTENWPAILKAAGSLLEAQQSSTVLIDATYRDKIIVRSDDLMLRNY